MTAVPLYLDNQATTPCDPRVLEAMLPWFGAAFGNPHSTHAFGRSAEAAVEAARAQVAAGIGAEAREIVFTSGATEANNLAIIGAARFRRRHEGRDRVVTLATEHKCVLESVRYLAREGFETVELPVQPDGLIDPAQVAAALDGQTALVSVMAANNEIGTLQPLAEIAVLAHRAGAWLHTDAAQAAGKVPIDVATLGIDLLSLSGHKIYGPKGIGALYVRRRPRVRLEPLLQGGGQERGLRSGTLPTPLCVGLGTAMEIATAGLAQEAERVKRLRDRLLEGLRQGVPGLRVNGSLAHRLPGNLNVALPGISAPALLERIDGDLAISTGSACTAASIEPSYVLKALGLDDATANASVRLAPGRFTEVGDIDRAVAILRAAVHAMRVSAASA